MLLFEYIFSICNNFLSYHGEPVFNNVSRLSRSSLKKNIFKNQNQTLTRWFVLGPEIALKRNQPTFLSKWTVSTEIDLYVFKYRVDYIDKDQLQAICLVTIEI